MTSIPTTEPLNVVAGDTVRWNRGDLLANYPGGTLSYTFIGANNPVVAVADATGTATLTASQTTSMMAGRWTFAASIVVGSERTTVNTGTVTVIPDPSLGASGTTNLSHARRVLSAIEATIEGRASQSDLDVRLSDGRRIMSLAHTELLTLRNAYKSEVQREDIAERLARGDKPRNRILVRM